MGERNLDVERGLRALDEAVLHLTEFQKKLPDLADQDDVRKKAMQKILVELVGAVDGLKVSLDVASER